MKVASFMAALFAVAIVVAVFVFAPGPSVPYTPPITPEAKSDGTPQQVEQQQASDRLREAREQFVEQNNDIVDRQARAEGYRPGYEGSLGGKCVLDGQGGTTLICAPFSDGSRASVGSKPGDWRLDDLCGRGFKQVVFISNVDQNLNCAGITLYHKAVNQYGVEVWTH